MHKAAMDGQDGLKSNQNYIIGRGAQQKLIFYNGEGGPLLSASVVGKKKLENI